MNAQRRKTLEKIKDALDELRTQLEDIKEEEENAYNSLPENLQYSERGDRMCDYMDTMSDAVDALEEIVERLEEITEE